jgi:hypothetical protein
MQRLRRWQPLKRLPPDFHLPLWDMISVLLNFSFPIVGGQLCFLIVLVRYLVEPLLMPRLFPTIFHKIGLADQRSLTNHVVSLMIKAVVFIVGCYPWIAVFLADQQYEDSTDPSKPDAKHGPRINITFGDLLGEWARETPLLRRLVSSDGPFSLVLPHSTDDVLVRDWISHTNIFRIPPSSHC